MYLKWAGSTSEDRCQAAVSELRSASSKLQGELSSLSYLQGVASAKFGFVVTANLLGDLLDVEEKRRLGLIERSVTSSHLVSRQFDFVTDTKLLDTVKAICCDLPEPQLALYLVKQLILLRGQDVLGKLRDICHLDLVWLTDRLQQDFVRQNQLPLSPSCNFKQFCRRTILFYLITALSLANNTCGSAVRSRNPLFLGKQSTSRRHCRLAAVFTSP